MCPLTAPLLLSNLLIILWFWASFSIKLDLEFGHRKCTDKVHLGVVWKRLQSGLNALQRYNNNNNCLFVTYTIIQSITSSEICALHLTNPSAHAPGAVGSRRCGTRGAVGGSVPCSRISPQSWTIPAGAEIQTHNQVQPRVISQMLYRLGPDCPHNSPPPPRLSCGLN